MLMFTRHQCMTNSLTMNMKSVKPFNGIVRHAYTHTAHQKQLFLNEGGLKCVNPSKSQD